MQLRAPSPMQWIDEHGGFLRLVDQTRLPSELVYVDCRDVNSVWEAIKSLQVRGAPAIGIAAAYGVCLAAATASRDSLAECIATTRQAAQYLATSRPTAVNLFWAVQRMERTIDEFESKSSKQNSGVFELCHRLLTEATAIHEEDRQMCHAIGRHGAALIPAGANLLTHCNAGGLATAEYGTALSVIFTCQDQEKGVHVFVDETRPLWQGSRLTAWELTQRKVPCTLICDSMSAHVMATRKIHAIIVGADRITAQGDVANKIGTYGLAVLAQYHKIPFYVAAPSSTFDLSLASGDLIPIEQRAATEVTTPNGIQIAPRDIAVYNPAFDVTPHSLVSALITEHGVIQPVNGETIHSHFAKSGNKT